jgi:hypothetical protein
MIKTTGVKFQPQGIPIVTLTDTSSVYPRGYHIGNALGLVGVEPDLIASNIRWGKTLFGILGTMVIWIYDLPKNLTVPDIGAISSISSQVAEDNSGGSNEINPALTVPNIPSIAQVSENSMLLLHDCETAFDEYVQASVVVVLDGADKVIGSYSNKFQIANDVIVGLLATDSIPSADISAYNYLKFWIKSSVTINSGDLQIMLDDTAGCISPKEQINIGALVANTWTEKSLLLANPALDVDIISIGIAMDNDKGVFNLWLDQIRATKGV